MIGRRECWTCSRLHTSTCMKTTVGIASPHSLLMNYSITTTLVPQCNVRERACWRRGGATAAIEYGFAMSGGRLVVAILGMIDDRAASKLASIGNFARQSIVRSRESFGGRAPHLAPCCGIRGCISSPITNSLACALPVTRPAPGARTGGEHRRARRIAAGREGMARGALSPVAYCGRVSVTREVTIVTSDKMSQCASSA